MLSAFVVPMSETITFDEPTLIQLTGVVDTGSTKKYSEVVDELEVTPRSTSVGVTAYLDGERVYSVSFRDLQDAPPVVTDLL